MSKENIGYLVPSQVPEPYNGYIRQRNGKVAQHIADIVGMRYAGLLDSVGPVTYPVPARTVLKADIPHVVDESDFYGGAVERIGHVGKSILHPALSSTDNMPDFYSTHFPSLVSECVLPGYTAFSSEAASTSLATLYAHFPGEEVRVKDPDESDGLGQSVYAFDGFHIEFTNAFKTDIAKTGIVFELNVQEPKTISIGYATFGNQTYSFVAHQKNDTDMGRNRYTGCNVQVIAGSMDGIHDLDLTDSERRAVAKVLQFYEAYSYFNPLASRLSFDVVEGSTRKGDRIEGVTDITARLGGTCPALVLAAERLRRDQTLSSVSAEVTLNYNPAHSLPEENGAEVFIASHPFDDLSSLRLTARLL